MPVVLKIYDQTGMTDVKRRTVRREATIADKLHRAAVPNICRTYAAFEEGEQFVIIMAVCARMYTVLPSASFLAEVSVRSPRKLFIFII